MQPTARRRCPLCTTVYIQSASFQICLGYSLSSCSRVALATNPAFLNKCHPLFFWSSTFRAPCTPFHIHHTGSLGGAGSYFDLASLLKRKIIWICSLTKVPNIGVRDGGRGRGGKEKEHPCSKYCASACFERHRPYRLLQFSLLPSLYVHIRIHYTNFKLRLWFRRTS